ncbi:MAG: ATP-binding protein, partial [Micrococcales bacterium]|nr:ATP-binding protein [Micrococcales bacterium]
CYDTWDWDTVHPVVRLDFAGSDVSSVDALDQQIGDVLAANERRLGVSTTAETLPGRLAELIVAAEAVYGQRVVLLVDEYDKPILDTITDPDLARKVRRRLGGLYSVSKSHDAHIRFVMLTGVSKFSKMSVFSDLNNLDDISLDARYSAVCGYTEDDLDAVFAPELEGLDRNEVREWYNGYSWLGPAVYNPFDLLLLFRKREFLPYWFETSTPGYLVDVLLSRQVNLAALENAEVTSTMLSSFDVGATPTQSLLFQTGYLTITSTRKVVGATRYRLGFPNREVRASFTEALLAACSPDPSEAQAQANRLPDLLEAGNLAGVEALLREHFAKIPHDWYRNTKIAQAEGYYLSVFYTFFASQGLDVIPEDTSNAGRLDMVVRYADQIFLFEVKTDAEPPGSAMAQIHDRGYADKYRAEGLPIHLVGVEFSREKRTLTRFEVQTINV